MKKVFYLLAAAAVATLSFAACNELNEPTREVEEVATVKTIHFDATTQDPATKSVFGEKGDSGYPTVWTANKKVLICANDWTPVEAPVTPKNEGKTATFNANITQPVIKGTTTYTFKAVSPSSAVYNNTINKVVIPDSQVPTDASVDENAHLMAAISSEFTEFPTTVQMEFAHIAAYGKFTLKEFPANVTINNIQLTANEAIAGQFTLDFSNKSLTAVSGATSNTITLSPAQGGSAERGTEKVYWFAIKPVNLAGKTMTVVVNTNVGPYTKTVSFTGNTGNFVAGKVASFTLNMTGTEPKYTLVTDYSQLTEGSEVIIVAKTADYAMAFNSPEWGATYGQRIQITKSNGGSTITAPSADVQRFALTQGVSSNTVQFACQGGTYDGYYIGANTSTGDQILKYKPSDASEYTSFQVNLLKGEIYLPFNVTRYGKLRYDPYNENFNTTDAYADINYVDIYKLEGSGANGDQLIIPDPEFSFTSGVIEGSGYFDLGNGGHLPAAGGTYVINYTVLFPRENGSVQTNNFYTFNWSNWPVSVTYSITAENSTSGTVTVTVPENTSSNYREGYIMVEYGYPNGDGTFTNFNSPYIWIRQDGVSTK